MLKKLAYFTGWIFLLCLSWFFCFALGFWLNWNALAIFLFWGGLVLSAILLWCTFLAISVFFKNKRYRHFLPIHRLSRQGYIIREHWRYGARIIKRIGRERKSIPWYLLVGSRCGKSTLLANSGLPCFDNDRDNRLCGPTNTLRWWFFRRVAILDVSSRFLGDNEHFRQAWAKLVRWCGHIPAPSGIIITFPMASLIEGERSTLHSLAQKQRTFIEPFIRKFGQHLPIYVVITQSDHFPHFSLWHQQLSVDQRQQALGYCWNTPVCIDEHDMMVLQPLFASLKQGMSRVRLSMGLSSSISLTEQAALLDFPDSFMELEPALRYTLVSLCEPSAYFSQSNLSGVWFCSSEWKTEAPSQRTSAFIQHILTHQLPSRHLQQTYQRWYQQPRGKLWSSIIFIAVMVWIAISSSLSWQRLQSKPDPNSSEALASFLVSDEKFAPFSLRFLPFQPLFSQQQKEVESRLLRIPSTPDLNGERFIEYENKVQSAEPAQKRTLILELANAILVWQEMRKGSSLVALQRMPPVSLELEQRAYSGDLTPLTRLVLERYYMQDSHGEQALSTARQLLARFIESDPDLTWLFSPNSEIPSIQADTFWPDMASAPVLDGIWTFNGNTMLQHWLTQIEQALGQPQSFIEQEKNRIIVQRQDVWSRYLVDVNQHLKADSTVILSRNDLFAMMKNQSAAMNFAARIRSELADIPPSEAQPWLNILRQLDKASTLDHEASWLNKADIANTFLQKSLTSWLTNAPKPTLDSVNERAWLKPRWQAWENARNLAAQEAISQTSPNTFLTRSLFSSLDGQEKNPLSSLYPALNALQSDLSPQNNEVGVMAVWALYQNDADVLLENAMTQSACWLNTQWQRDIIWPLENELGLYDHEELQSLTQSRISDFLRGPAKNLLQATRDGFSPAEYEKRALPLSPKFIELIRPLYSPELLQDPPERASTRENDKKVALQAKIDTLRDTQAELEKRVLKTTVASLPATIPEGARVIPIGTELTLNCLNGSQQLSSMNFAEKVDFHWQPGQCQSVTVKVIFPDFSVSYHMEGHNSWASFMKQFSTGASLLKRRNFGHDAYLLNQMGIQHILVRFKVSNSEDIDAVSQEWEEINSTLIALQHQLDNIGKKLPVSTLLSLSSLPTHIASCK
ncbi:TPA: type VI secretion protein IcmF/TssM N-terminal domain-containing protein [Providencia alcalifaciens]